MGAAGYVGIYNEEAVRTRFKALFPDNDIDEDWWYLKTCSADLGGTRYIFDYSDDQGVHEGSSESFWFKSDPGAPWGEQTTAQKRVLQVLRDVGVVACPEVWT